MKNHKKILRNIQNSMCFVDVYAGPYPDIPFTYNAFFIHDSEHIVMHSQGFFNESVKIEIRFHDAPEPVKPIKTYHDNLTGITIFKVPPLERYSPLSIDRENIYEPGKKCYIPKSYFYDPVCDLISGQIETVMNVESEFMYRTTHEIEFRELSCPLLDETGTVIGIAVKEYFCRIWDEFELDWQERIAPQSSGVKKYINVKKYEKIPGSLPVVLSAKHILEVAKLGKYQHLKQVRKAKVLTE